MTHLSFSRAIFLGCILVAAAGFAQADIVKCVNEEGMVTYTDVPCRNGIGIAETSAVTKLSVVSDKISTPERMIGTPEMGRDVTLLKKNTSNRSFALDVETLKAAKTAMLAMDQVSSLQRQQKIAKVN